MCGYVLGALDSLPFYERMQKEYLVPLQQKYPCPKSPEGLVYDEFYIWAIHHPEADLHIPTNVGMLKIKNTIIRKYHNLLAYLCSNFQNNHRSCPFLFHNNTV